MIFFTYQYQGKTIKNGKIALQAFQNSLVWSMIIRESKGIKLIKERKKKLPAKIVNFQFTSDMKIVFPLYSLRRNTFLSSTNDEYNTTFYKEASRKDRAYFLSCGIQRATMVFYFTHKGYDIQSSSYVIHT
jgi:hypothetical protein